MLKTIKIGYNFQKRAGVKMSNRFTEKAEKALNSAVTIAEELGHTYIGSEHILLSLAKDSNSSASIALLKNGIKYEKILKAVKEYSGHGSKSILTPKDMTPRCKKIVENSYRLSLKYGAIKIGTEHILLSILDEKECIATKILVFLGLDITIVADEVLTVIKTAEKHFESRKDKKDSNESSTLIQYGRNLTELAKAGKLDPVIGRERETERLIRILCRKSKNNPCLIGEAGVGKTAIVEGLAIRIASGNVPSQIKGKKIISVDLTSMVAGAKYRGDFEERIKNLLNESAKNKSVILFIDEIHTIVGAGSAEGAIDAANILKPQLSRAEIQIIGATTFSEYHKYIEKDAALERRFQALTVNEPTHSETVNILKGLKSKYEDHHSIKISDEAIEAAVSLSERYIQDRFFPDKAIDVIDEACAKRNVKNSEEDDILNNYREKMKQIEDEKINAVKNENYTLAMKLRDMELEFDEELYRQSLDNNKESNVVLARDIEEIINEMTGIPIAGMYDSLNKDKLVYKFKQKIFGQDAAVEALASAVMRSETGITNPDRPKGVFLFLGSSGVGKTELAKIMSEELFFTKKALIRYDMSEFSEKNSVTMLIGSPPGYVGYEEGGALTEKIRRQPYSVLLFDEIEKAHKDVLNLFLQIMDDGVLRDSCGRTVSFKNTYVIMTSNALGNNSVDKNVGFLNHHDEGNLNEKLYGFFSPEFINRIDSIIRFKDLDYNSFISVTEKKLSELTSRLVGLGIDFSYDSEVCKYVAKGAIKEKLGARAVSRIITSEFENRISSYMLNGKIKKIISYIKDDVLEMKVVYSAESEDSEVLI